MATTTATSALPTELQSTVKDAATSDAPKMTHLPQMQQNFPAPLIANENAYLGDVVSSQARDAQKPITGGFFRLQTGTPLIYTYTYNEVKIIVEGDYTITDVTSLSEEERKGETSAMKGVQTAKAKPGDVFYFPKGVTIKFETVNGGYAFYTGQRAEGEA